MSSTLRVDRVQPQPRQLAGQPPAYTGNTSRQNLYPLAQRVE
jgi:hypothetical protein